MSNEGQNVKGKKTSRAKPPKTKTSDQLKCSLLLSKENNLRLSVLASLKMTTRSALLNQILDEALRGVVVSLRGALATENGAGGGIMAEADTEAA